MRPLSRPLLGLLLIVCLSGSLGWGSWRGGSPFFAFRSPGAGLLSLAAEANPVEVELRVPFFGRVESLAVQVDGDPVLDLAGGGLVLERGRAVGSVGPLAIGRHTLRADGVFRLFWFFRLRLETETWLERVALDRPDDCEALNQVECLLPFPSSRYLEAADTSTGYRVSYPEGTLPSAPFPLLSAGFEGQDGFSPAAQILTHFPGGVDPELSGASRLLPETRSIDRTSLRRRSPTLLLDVDRGMKPVPHFIERDSRAAAGPAPEREVLFLRPAVSLTPGHRYVVAMRNLVHPDGTPVAAEPVFAALRDRRPTDIPAVETRRAAAEEIFRLLRRRGVSRDDLVLAFDFVVQSDEELTREILAMRDRSFEWLAGQTGPTFTVFPFAGPDDDPTGDVSLENDCSLDGERTAREIRGTYSVPLFLSSDPLVEPVIGGRLVDDDDDGLPDAQGLMQANFTVVIPCAALDPELPRLAPMLGGHGLFGDGRGIAGISQALDAIDIANGGEGLQRITGATDWLGLSRFDFSFDDIFAPNFILNAVLFDANNFGTLPDRLRQGMTNTLVLGRMLKEGRFNQHEAFQRSDGSGVLPGADEGLDFFGISLGGIMGTEFAALSPDVERVAIDVPASNFSILIQRSTAIGLIDFALSFLNPDPMSQAMFFAITEELWDSGEPAGYLGHVTRDPLPGSGRAKDLLMTVALYDGVVSNQATEIAARSLRLPNLHDRRRASGSAVSDLVGIRDRAGPLAEGDRRFVGAMVWYDLGAWDLSDPAVAALVPPLANGIASSSCEPHGASFRTGAATRQITTWLRRGVIEDRCNGLCDGFTPGGDAEPFELSDGRTTPCDPLAGP